MIKIQERKKWIFQEKVPTLHHLSSRRDILGNFKLSMAGAYGNYTFRAFWEYQVWRNQSLERPPNSSMKIKQETKKKRQDRKTWRKSRDPCDGVARTSSHSYLLPGSYVKVFKQYLTRFLLPLYIPPSLFGKIDYTWLQYTRYTTKK